MITQTCMQLVSFCIGSAAPPNERYERAAAFLGRQLYLGSMERPGNTYLQISTAQDTGRSPVSAFFKTKQKKPEKKKKSRGFS